MIEGKLWASVVRYPAPHHMRKLDTPAGKLLEEIDDEQRGGPNRFPAMVAMSARGGRPPAVLLRTLRDVGIPYHRNPSQAGSWQSRNSLVKLVCHAGDS